MVISSLDNVGSIVVKGRDVEIVDLNGCPLSYAFYAGDAGRKEGILIDGEPWFLKFPRTTRDLKGKHLASYTSSPVSEYIGSHVYESLGIPVHETFLAFYEGKIVCACKDFTRDGLSLVEFKNLKNSTREDIPSCSGSPADGSSTFLADILGSISTVDPLCTTPGVVERFWDMFVVDAFIKNPDRHNGNWGLLKTRDNRFSLAPVYDNGNCLFPKRPASVAAARLEDADAIKEDAFGTNLSCYRVMDPETEEGYSIHPFEYMLSSANADLDAAILRITERIDLEAVSRIVDEIPEEAYGLVVFPDAMKESCKRLFEVRYEQGLLPAAEAARARIAGREKNPIRIGKRFEEMARLSEKSSKAANEERGVGEDFPGRKETEILY